MTSKLAKKLLARIGRFGQPEQSVSDIMDDILINETPYEKKLRVDKMTVIREGFRQARRFKAEEQRALSHCSHQVLGNLFGIPSNKELQEWQQQRDQMLMEIQVQEELQREEERLQQAHEEQILKAEQAAEAEKNKKKGNFLKRIFRRKKKIVDSDGEEDDPFLVEDITKERKGGKALPEDVKNPKFGLRGTWGLDEEQAKKGNWGEDEESGEAFKEEELPEKASGSPGKKRGVRGLFKKFLSGRREKKKKVSAEDMVYGVGSETEQSVVSGRGKKGQSLEDQFYR